MLSDDREAAGVAAGLPRGRGQHAAVGLPDFARDDRLAGFGELVAGRDDREARPGPGRDGAAAGRREQTDLDRAQAGARGQQQVAG